MRDELTSYSAADGIALLRLEREGARNAINTQMLEEMLGHLAAAKEDEAVRVLVISSNDHLGLSAGADVREELDEPGRVRRMQLFADLYDELTAYPKPTVAACHGSVVGGGNLRLRFPGAALGVPVGPARLVTLCGLSTAKYLLLTSRNVSADEALRMGLIHRVAPAARTEEIAMELAGEVAAHPPESVARIKKMLLDWDGVVERSAEEGRGQVAWQRTGPGLPHRD